MTTPIRNFKATSMSGISEKVASAAKAIREADALLITAGAGMGVDSGLPDFRGNDGFWRTYPVVAKLGLSFEQMANPSWFGTDPELAWAFYGHRFNLYRNTHPHRGFNELLNLATTKPFGAFVFTSNVDGQFQKAGFDPERIVECHGSIHHFQCTTGCNSGIWEAREQVIQIQEESFRALQPLPRCPSCGALARPNVLMFGDGSWLDSRSQRQDERFQEWLQSLSDTKAKVSVIELGAGTAIPTVRRTSEIIAAQLRGTLIRINARETQVPPGHIGLQMGAAEAMAAISEEMRLSAG
jgi:NAD-dependent SIR2 family protein deacetylase